MDGAPAKSLVPWILAAVVALIGWGSLYPFNFKPDAIEGGVLAAFSELSWARAGRGDRISNVLLYVPLGFCLYLWFESARHRLLVAVLAILAGAMLSLGIEVAQVFLSPRVPSLTDLTLNTAGTAAGVVAGNMWRLLSRLVPMPAVGGDRSNRLALAVVVLWLGWRLAPFVPILSIAKIKLALAPLFEPRLGSAETLGFLACWLIVAQAVFALSSRHRGIEVLLGLIAAVLAGRLLVDSQAFVPAELMALLLLLPVLAVVNRLAPDARRLVMLAAASGVFLAERLAPFRFGERDGSFDLWPFLGWMSAGFPVDLQGLLALAFITCALIWVARDLGLRLEAAIGAVAGAVLATEILQLWLPDHTASITDPVLVLALGLGLRAIDPSRPRRRLTFR